MMYHPGPNRQLKLLQSLLQILISPFILDFLPLPRQQIRLILLKVTGAATRRLPPIIAECPHAIDQLIN